MTRRLIGLVLLLASCQPLAMVGPPLPRLQGQIGERWRTQATYADFAPGGTASLIEPGSERTVAGGTTTAGGSFAIAFEPDFQPAAGASYWLDVSRRLANTWISLRTVAVWDGHRWLTASNGPDAPGDPVLVNARTTAISLALRDAGLALSVGLGRLGGGGLGGGRTEAVLRTLEAQVRDDLTADRDPLARADGAVLAVEPAQVAAGDRITVHGYGFGPSGRLTVAGEALTVTAWQPGRIEALMPSLGQGGDLVVEVGAGKAYRSRTPLRLRQAWRTLPPLPAPVGGDSVAVGEVEGELFVAGGKGPTGQALASAWRFDRIAGRWVSRAPLLTPRYGMASAVLDGKLYAIGGWTDAGGYAATVEAYDPVTDSWQVKAPLPAPRLGAAAATVGGKLYVFGGYDGSEQATAYAYDPAADAWTTVAAMPASRFRHGAAVVDGRILVAGGRSSGQLTTEASLYDPQADLWIMAAGLPAGRAGGVLAGDGRRAWFAVGNDGLPRSEAWELLNGAWRPLLAAPTARAGSSGAFVDGEIYVVGGASGDGTAGSRVEAYSP